MESTVTDDGDIMEEDERGGKGAPPVRVVVVGAGMAGVGAVGKLVAGGIKDVVLLEAAAWPGGRVQSVHMDDGFVELGAQYLHGKTDIYDLAEREGMLAEDESEDEEVTDTLLQYSDFKFHTSDGSGVDPVTVVKNLKVLEDLQVSSSQALEKGEATDVNVPLGQFYRDRYPACVRVMKGPEDLRVATIRWMESWEITDCGGSVDQMSLPGAGLYLYNAGNGTKETTRGMAEVFKCLLRDSVSPQSLHLNKPVKTIHWNNGTCQQQAEGMCSKDFLMEEVFDNLALNHNSHQQLCDSSVENQEMELQIPCQKDSQEQYPAEKNSLLSSDHQSNHENEFHSGKSNMQTQQNSVCAYQNQREGDFKAPNFNTASTTQNPNAANMIPDFTAANMSSNFNSDTMTSTFKAASPTPNYKVRIECEDGTVFEADHVIVTPSIGVLRENQGLFNPSLPRVHQDAIRSMGFGDVAKMFLFWHGDKGISLQQCASCVRCSSVEWQKNLLGFDVEGMVPLWLDGVHPALKSAKNLNKMSDGRQWYEDVCCYSVVQSHDFCLVAWVGGEAAIIMESLPQGEVRDVLHELLTVFLRKPDLPPPCGFLRTQWQANPYTRGAYSYLATGVPLELHEMLSSPLPSPQNPVLQLAGEACSKNYYSTMHGALQSGCDAAQAILRHYNLAE